MSVPPTVQRDSPTGRGCAAGGGAGVGAGVGGSTAGGRSALTGCFAEPLLGPDLPAFGRELGRFVVTRAPFGAEGRFLASGGNR